MRRKPAVAAHLIRELGNVRKTGVTTSALAGLSLALALSASAFANEPRCNKARHVAGSEKPLPTLETRSKRERPSASWPSVFFDGRHAGPLQEGYLPRRARARARPRGAEPVEILNRGKGGETIAHMLARLDRDVIAEKPIS